MGAVEDDATSEGAAERGWGSGAALLAIGRASTLVLQAAQLALVARLLSPVQFGSWAAATALVMVASAVADCGLGPTAVIYLASRAGCLDDIVAANAVALLGATLLTCVASIAFGASAALATLSLVPWLVIVRLQAPSISALQQRFRFRRIVAGDVIGTSVQTVMLVGLLLAAGTTGQTVRVLLIGACLAMGGVVELKVVVIARLWPSRSCLRRRAWLGLLGSAASLGVVNGVSMLHSRVDQLILALLVSRATLGGYAVAYRVVDATVALASVASRAGFSVLVNRREEARALVTRGLVRTWAVVGMGAGLGVWLGAPMLMNVVGGGGYPAAPGLLRILAPIVAVAAINNAAGQALVADGATRFLLKISLIGLAANAVLCLTLIPELGAPGAGAASLITESFGMLMVVGRARRPGVRRGGLGPRRDRGTTPTGSHDGAPAQPPERRGSMGHTSDPLPQRQVEVAGTRE